MIFIISPAKQMTQSHDMFECSGLPGFMEKTYQVYESLQQMSNTELKTLWKCSDSIAETNIERIRHMDLEHDTRCAVMSYVGIQYQHLAAHVMDQDQLDYLQTHLFIVSGLYGLVRPFEGVVPYRLEMQSKLSVAGSRNLYDFWSESLAQAIAKSLDSQSDEERVLINIASAEYAKAVVPACVKNHGIRVVTCLFKTLEHNKLTQRSTEAKIARGTFMNWCAARAVQKIEDLKAFNELGYAFCSELSDDETIVFVREK